MRNRHFGAVCAILAAIITITSIAIIKRNTEQFANFVGFIPVVIDAGHGGGDPGKVGRIAHESELNLVIAQKVAEKLSLRGFFVIYTREDMDGLVEVGKNWVKKVDNSMRREIIDRSNAALMVSIHQNAHPNASSKGAQIFYNDCLEENKILADILQRKLAEVSEFENKRLPVCNNEYFILKGNTMPSCTIECGFLTNKYEEELLNNPQYQDRIAEAIYLGILEYFSLSP
ncbi:MAG: N-acetylmuramoyl-L-alanine amidase [Eubacteriaceae bacterium]|nr:N-acetylmuramoyl-L-alanine amidase [Eubacteriaceae bacterium]